MIRIFSHVQYDHHCGGVVVPLLTAIIEDVVVLGLYDIIRLAGYDLVLCLVAVRRFQDIHSCQCGS